MKILDLEVLNIPSSCTLNGVTKCQKNVLILRIMYGDNTSHLGTMNYFVTMVVLFDPPIVGFSLLKYAYISNMM
jgi:hypothetical protein